MDILGDPEPQLSTGQSFSSDFSVLMPLAALSALEYDRVRETEAAKLGVRVSTLDAEVKKLREQMRPQDDAKAPAFTDEALALVFSDHHCDDLRYVAAWGVGMSGRAPFGNRMQRSAHSTVSGQFAARRA